MKSLVTQFEGNPLTTLTYQGRPAWIAREVGAAIGYEQEGKRFATSITGRWKKDFREGHDYVVLTGKELDDFKALQEASKPRPSSLSEKLDAFRAAFDGTYSVPSKTQRLLLLFESGLTMALMNTKKPAGRKLRRFVVDDVLPQIMRDGAYLPERKVEAGQIIDPVKNRELDLKERELAIEEQKLTFTKAEMLAQKVDHLGGLFGGDAIQALQARVIEIIDGREHPELKPLIGDGGWLTPTEIGKRLDISANAVGHLISALKLRGDIDGISRSYLNTTPGGTRNVRCFLYSPKAVRMIEDLHYKQQDQKR